MGKTCFKPHSLDVAEEFCATHAATRLSLPDGSLCASQSPSQPHRSPVKPDTVRAPGRGKQGRSRSTCREGAAGGEAPGGRARAGDEHRHLHPGSSCSQICHNLSKSRNRSCPGRGLGGRPAQACGLARGGGPEGRGRRGRLGGPEVRRTGRCQAGLQTGQGAAQWPFRETDRGGGRADGKDRVLADPG